MKPEESAWQKLVLASRQVLDERDASAPYGFATRVASLAMAGERHPLASLFDRFSWRALGVAGILAATSIAANYSLFGPGEDDVLSDETTVAALFDVS